MRFERSILNHSCLTYFICVCVRIVCGFVLFAVVFDLRLLYHMLPFSLNCPFWIASTVFSNVYCEQRWLNNNTRRIETTTTQDKYKQQQQHKTNTNNNTRRIHTTTTTQDEYKQEQHDYAQTKQRGK
jgi:hypothetical protein